MLQYESDYPHCRCRNVILNISISEATRSDVLSLDSINSLLGSLSSNAPAITDDVLRELIEEPATRLLLATVDAPSVGGAMGESSAAGVSGMGGGGMGGGGGGGGAGVSGMSGAGGGNDGDGALGGDGSAGGGGGSAGAGGSPASGGGAAGDDNQAGAPKIVGMLTLVIFRIPSGVRAWIEDVAVDTEMRGNGVGAALVRRAIEIARRSGAGTVDLTSRPSREAANRLYRRLGFEQRSTNVYRYTIDADIEVE